LRMRTIWSGGRSVSVLNASSGIPPCTAGSVSVSCGWLLRWNFSEYKLFYRGKGTDFLDYTQGRGFVEDYDEAGYLGEVGIRDKDLAYTQRMAGEHTHHVPDNSFLFSIIGNYRNNGKSEGGCDLRKVGSCADTEEQLTQSRSSEDPLCSRIDDAPVSADHLGEVRGRDLHAVAGDFSFRTHPKTVCEQKPYDPSLGRRIGEFPHDLGPHTGRYAMLILIHLCKCYAIREQFSTSLQTAISVLRLSREKRVDSPDTRLFLQ